MYESTAFLLFIPSDNICYRYDATCRALLKTTEIRTNLENNVSDISIMCDNKYLIHNDK